jgi:hypothetical protein
MDYGFPRLFLFCRRNRDPFPGFTDFEYSGSRRPDASLLSGAPMAPEAAPRNKRRNVGHSMWLGAGQTAACCKPSRTALSF